jgi:lipooligosaccharide transport system ATP-binding protein
VELRFARDSAELAIEKLQALGDRIEVLPDRVLISTDDGDAATARAHELGVEPESALVRRSTLEDVFLRLTGRTLVD